MISRNWWNDKWFKRYLAVLQLMRQMQASSTSDEGILISSNWLELQADMGIDESVLGGGGQTTVQEVVSMEIEDEDGVEYVVPEDEDE